MEIIDPETLQPVSDGTTGEVVFTTLTRDGMPLIRYRTGKLSSFMDGACPCKTVLQRLGVCMELGDKEKLLVGDFRERNPRA